MKIFNILLMTAVMAFAGCDNHLPVKPVMALTDTTCGSYLPTDNFAVVRRNRDSALKYIDTFSNMSRILFKDSVPIRGFTIRAVDLLSVLGMPASLADSSICQYKHARVYLGYKPGFGFKLYIVPVDSACLKGSNPGQWIAGKDVLLDSTGSPVSSIRNGNVKVMGDQSGFVVDLNAPCPNTCPENILQQ